MFSDIHVICNVKCNKDEFFHRYITMDERMKHGCFTTLQESNRKSAEWTERNELNPKRGKMQRSAGQGYGIRILGCAWYYIHQLTSKKAQPSTTSIT
jgi:hypothetical protein